MQWKHEYAGSRPSKPKPGGSLSNTLYRILQKTFVVCALLAGVSVVLSHGYSIALLAALVMGGILRKRTLPHFTFLLFVGGLALRLGIVAVLHTPPESDFLLLYEAAQSLLAGDKSFLDTVYFSLWAYQSMFVVWQAALLKICNSLVFLKAVNAILSAGTVCVLYRTMRGFVSEKAAQLSALFLTAHPFLLTFHVVLSNQIPSAFFLVLGLWVLIGKDWDRWRVWRFPLAGFLLQVGNTLRSEAIILIVAVVTWGVFAILRHFKNPGAVAYFLAGICLLLTVYAVTGKVADTAIRVTGVNPYGLQNGDPDWKFVVGLNAETGGTYSSKDWSNIYPSLDEENQVTDQTRQIQREMIQERVHMPVGDWVQLLRNKIRVLWSSDNLFWAFHHAVDRDPGAYLGCITRYDAFQLLKEFNFAWNGLAIVLFLAGLWNAPSSQLSRPPASYLPHFVFFAAFSAFLLIEVQPRYVYLPQVFVFAGSAYGMEPFLKGGPHGGNR